MEKLKKIRVFSLAKFQAFLMTLVGIMCGVLYSFGGLLIDTLVTIGLLSSESMSTPGLSFGTVLAFGALIGMPILFSIIGFLAGVLEALLYNLFAKWFGGVKIDLEQKENSP